VMASPWLGAWILRNTGLIARMLLTDSVRPGAIGETAARIYADRLRPPGRARATTLLYRGYLRRLASTLRPPRARMAVPARLLFGERDLAISPALAAGFEDAGDDCALELVADSGHFLPEEKPELLAARAREFFG